MTRAPPKMIDFYHFSLVGDGPPLRFWYFCRTLFFGQNPIILWDKKHTALFQTHVWEKSSFFFSALVRVFAQMTDIRKYLTDMPSAGVNRVRGRMAVPKRMNFRKKSKRPLIHLLENHVANLLRKTSEKKTDIKVQKCDGLDWMGLVIIGHRSSKSTFGAYNIVFKGTRQC